MSGAKADLCPGAKNTNEGAAYYAANKKQKRSACFCQLDIPFAMYRQ